MSDPSSHQDDNKVESLHYFSDKFVNMFRSLNLGYGGGDIATRVASGQDIRSEPPAGENKRIQENLGLFFEQNIGTMTIAFTLLRIASYVNTDKWTPVEEFVNNSEAVQKMLVNEENILKGSVRALRTSRGVRSSLRTPRSTIMENVIRRRHLTNEEKALLTNPVFIKYSDDIILYLRGDRKNKVKGLLEYQEEAYLAIPAVKEAYNAYRGEMRRDDENTEHLYNEKDRTALSEAGNRLLFISNTPWFDDISQSDADELENAFTIIKRIAAHNEGKDNKSEAAVQSAASTHTLPHSSTEESQQASAQRRRSAQSAASPAWVPSMPKSPARATSPVRSISAQPTASPFPSVMAPSAMPSSRPSSPIKPMTPGRMTTPSRASSRPSSPARGSLPSQTPLRSSSVAQSMSAIQEVSTPNSIPMVNYAASPSKAQGSPSIPASAFHSVSPQSDLTPADLRASTDPDGEVRILNWSGMEKGIRLDMMSMSELSSIAKAFGSSSGMSRDALVTFITGQLRERGLLTMAQLSPQAYSSPQAQLSTSVPSNMFITPVSSSNSPFAPVQSFPVPSSPRSASPFPVLATPSSPTRLPQQVGSIAPTNSPQMQSSASVNGSRQEGLFAESSASVPVMNPYQSPFQSVPQGSSPAQSNLFSPAQSNPFSPSQSNLFSPQGASLVPEDMFSPSSQSVAQTSNLFSSQ